MKLSKIITIILALLCVVAVGFSIVSVINYDNSGKTDGTSPEDTSNPPSESTPSGSEEPAEPTLEFLVGSYVKTQTDFVNTENVTRVTGGVACVKKIDNITYCYVKYDISDLSLLYVTYYNQTFDDVANIFRVSFDEVNWSLLNNYRQDYSGSWNQAKLPMNNNEYVYICFYTITDNEMSLAETLADFESRLSESTKVYISNIGG